MTKEELEKEAKEYGKKATAWLEDREPLDQRDIENAYLAGAEPREKRIAELEKENAELKAQLESERDLPAIAYMQGAEKQKKKNTDQLTKAKYLISKCIKLLKLYKKTNDLETVEQLENFLKESEVEK